MTEAPANSQPWWDAKGQKYLDHGDGRDRPEEFSRLAREAIGSVLEVGPAFGALCKYLPPTTQYLGVELSPVMAAKARQMHPSRVFLQGDVLALAPALLKAADTVMACQFLEHFADPRPAMEALVHMARQRVVVSVPWGLPTDSDRENDGHLSGWRGLDDFAAWLAPYGTAHLWAGAENHLCATLHVPGGRQGSLAADLEKTYDGAAWYARHAAPNHAAWARSMAADIVADLKPQSVMDLGAGGFVLCNALAARGVSRVVGVEHSTHALPYVGKGVLPLLHDLRKPLKLQTKFDVVVCMEVAEHIDRKYEKTLLDSILGLATRYVVFSAGRPGQGGTNHVNLRDRLTWMNIFEARGWETVHSLQKKWSPVWRAAKVPEYYWTNLLVLRPRRKKEESAG